jgi:hypothetical protein
LLAELGVRLIGFIQGGIDRSARESSGDSKDNPLSAAALYQVIMSDRDIEVRHMAMLTNDQRPRVLDAQHVV